MWRAKIFDSESLIALLKLLRTYKYRNISITPSSHQLVNSRLGNEFAKDLIGILGWSRLFSRDTAEYHIFDLMQKANILNQKDDCWQSLLRVSSLGDHLFLHSAYPTAQKDSVFFGPDTYRFCNEINNFLVSNTTHITRAVDIGTGCGPGAILVADYLPACEVLGVDINYLALDLARANAKAAALQNISFLKSDLLKNTVGNFDFIMANPPYLVDNSVRSYRHGGGKLGYQLSLDIIDTAIERLAPGGTLLLYTGVAIVENEDLFYGEISQKLSHVGFDYQYKEIDPDIFGEELINSAYKTTDRIAAVILKAQKPQ